MRTLLSVFLCAFVMIMIPTKPQASTESISSDYYEGFLDYAGKSGVFGWDTNLNDMNESVEVTIFIDNKEVATVTANLYRPDLESATSNGRHAFFYQIPAWYFDGMEHTIKAMHESGGTQVRTELYSSPRTFTCALD